MNNLFEIAGLCLHEATVNEKLVLTHKARQLMETNALDFSQRANIKEISQVQFPERPLLLPVRNMPKRTLGTPAGVAAFFHAICHVEFMAIYLAWDIIYRFRGMPDQFYRDWLKVADEEALHFQLIISHLQLMNCEYGDLPAHAGLWDHARDTSSDLLARLALIPRCMEARGLDVTPALIAKFQSLGDLASVQLLTRILTDEVGHVERGSYWFKTLCLQQGLNYETHFRQLVEHYYRGGKPKGPFNREMRIIAGFSETELDWLELNA
jgi:uncharacterized ferritin-like protein (DUF455 family)